MKELLIESYEKTKKDTGIDPSKPGNMKQILINESAYNTYISALSQGLVAKDVKPFKILANNTRRTLLENSMYQLNPYETLALPLLRVFFPKTIAKELVSVIPMDKPEIVRGFVRVSFKRFGDSQTYSAPSKTDISRGPEILVPLTSAASIIGGAPIDILNIAGLTSSIAHIEKDFQIVEVTFSDATTSECAIGLTVDGGFTAAVASATASDTISGRLNLETGILEVASVANSVTRVSFRCNLSLEENTINPRATFNIDKLRLIAKDRQISTDWSVQAEQDLKSLFNVDIQAELVSVIGQQIVNDIDREIVNALIYASERMNGTTHNGSFTKAAPAGYTWGPKQWMENILVPLNDVSAAIYNDTNIAAANVVACNPLDAAILESLQEFRYTGKSDADGDLGYESATVANGKWKVLVSNVVPQGKMLAIYKPAEELKSTFIFAPYVPCVLSPYPLGNTPSLTVLSRYGTQLVRPQGIGIISIL
jgi:hypothetical protein